MNAVTFVRAAHFVKAAQRFVKSVSNIVVNVENFVRSVVCVRTVVQKIV